MRIRFVSSNENKVAEVMKILSSSKIEIVPISLKIDELQTEDPRKLVTHKVLEAFKQTGREVFVEHTGLYIKEWNGFPGGLTQIFWDKLKADKFSSVIGNLQDTSVEAKTTIAFCDGLKIYFFEGAVWGTVPKLPVGDRAFQWDCVFIPEGHTETFAQMGDKKNEISMRRKALSVFRDFLDENFNL